ncbi:helix-turn-helix domain-containing protein [Micromonospora lutea]|uniref:helix-turn-helix domain-containing protein n=1 Tax=Micromonospora lutea TaxID=419825 RepID=UPI001951862A|nr:helix-turn-helix transcriptional regulator [Micromonospora lutea]
MSPSPPDPVWPHPTPLGPLVARLRVARGWSQSRLAAELCAAAGVFTLSRHEISRWERQVRVPGRFWRGWLLRILAAPAVQPAGSAVRPAAGPVAGKATGRRTATPGLRPLETSGPAVRPGTASRPGGSPRSARRAAASVRPRSAGDPTRRRAGGSAQRIPTH